jgi:sirohydrochlorin ferrochelatase
MFNVRTIFIAVVIGLGLSTQTLAQSKGVLLMAHGGSATWNEHVTKLASEVDRTAPTEVAFGMATRANLQGAVDRLRARGVTEIVAVPLFVSSWSSVITSTEYLLGQRSEAPPELAIFAKMNHSAHGAAASGGAASHHGGADHAAPSAPDPKSRIQSPVPIRMTPALNDHPVVAGILASRARSISTNPEQEAVIIVAHGPVGDEENRRWLTDMGSLATRIQQTERFKSIDYLTLRDDAPKPVRDQATAELRGLVTKHLNDGRKVLIVPLLVSFGGIERGLRERLEGLQYAMPAAALVPDDRLVAWVLAMANQR